MVSTWLCATCARREYLREEKKERRREGEAMMLDGMMRTQVHEQMG